MSADRSELAVVEGLWQTLDNNQLIKDVAMKGKFISSSIKFIAHRSSISIEEAKQEFFDEVFRFLRTLISNKQLHRAIHVIKNLQINETYFLFDYYQKEDDAATRELIKERLIHIDSNFSDKEKTLASNHTFFELLSGNFSRHAKFVEAVNRSQGSSRINAENIETIIFETFMKQPQAWRNEVSTDVFFKTKNARLMHVLDKHCFFTYILRNEFYAILKQWLQEAYWCKAGNMMRSTISEPETFDGALLCVFREWSFEPSMMGQIARREKDVIKNDFAKLGLFESREAKSICRKLNRFFTTNTFYENFPSVKTDQVTKFVIENNLMDLLPESFIDFRYLQLLLENLDVIYMKAELVLVLKTRNLMSSDTGLDEFVMMVNATSDYVAEHDTKFDQNIPPLKLMNATFQGLSAKNFDSIKDINSFTVSTANKMKSNNEKAPTVEELLENHHSINIDFIRNEFEKTAEGELNISFDDASMCAAYTDDIRLNFSNYVQSCQSVFGTYLLLKDIIKNFISISKSQILIGCEEVARLAVENSTDKELVSHVMTFLEISNVNSRTLRCYLQLMKLKLNDNESKGFGAQLDESIKIGTECRLRDVEALEVFWSTRKVEEPLRSYLNPFIVNNDWFRLLLLAQYLDYPLKSFIKICDERVKDKAIRDNLIRSVLYEASPALKRRCSFSKRRRSRTMKDFEDEETQLFPGGKFLDIKSDLFAIILKCDENLNQSSLTFEEFQKMIQKKVTTNDLLNQAFAYDWPLISVVAAMSKQYRYKFCWITWLVLSSDFNWHEKRKTVEELADEVIMHCIQNGFVQTLDVSLSIFYPESSMKIFTNFLWLSKTGNFEDMDKLLKTFIVKLDQDNYNLIAVKGKDESINFTMRCIVKHLQSNFQSILQQEKYLDVLCRSEISQFSCKADFAFLKKMCKILEHTNMRMNFEELCNHDKNSLTKAGAKICESLIDDHQFEAAIEVADLFSLPKGDFVFNWWIHMWSCEDKNSKNFETKKYLTYVNKYNLSMEVMIKFLKAVIKDLDPCVKKFNMMKFLLRNSWTENAAELDKLEYEIILLYVKLNAEGKSMENLKPLHSEYYNTSKDKSTARFHNSLFELKSLAKVDEVTISQKRLENSKELEELDKLILILLDAGDIVQVLRIQEMFARAPEDLKLLVYMISIAENLNSIYDLAKEERQMISSFGLMSNKFNRLTLRNLRTSSSTSISSSPSNDQLSESVGLDDSSGLKNSYRENKETFQALQGLVCKMGHGVVHAQRIALIYRVSLFLNRNFVDLIKMKDAFELLELAASSECENKLLVMHDIMVASEMTNDEIAEFIAKEISASIIRTRFLQFNKDTELLVGSTSSWSPTREVMDDLWGFSLSKDLHLILELCTSTTLLGNYLLKYYGIFSKESADIPFQSDDIDNERICQHLNRMLSPQILSLKKQNIIRVELLITAHECFAHECSTEGIGLILNLAKSLCNHLAAKKSFTLIVKLLCGIGRYREMFYCFEILIKNEQFEALLGQFTDKQTNGLKMAILNYLNEYHPGNKDFYKMAASHFMMYSELANIWRRDCVEKIQSIIKHYQVKVVKTGRINSNQIQQLEIPYLKKLDKDVISGLSEALNAMIHATELMAMQQKTDMAIKFSSYCELIAMQIHLAKVGLESEDKMCPCVINQESNPEKFQYFANYELSVAQSMILEKNTELKIDFSKAIFVHLLLEDENYLQDYISRLEITDDIIESVVKINQRSIRDKISMKQENILNELVSMVNDKGLAFRLASLLGLKSIGQAMLNNQGTYCYVLDSKYGTVDIL